MKVKDLKPNPKNPRRITDEKLQQLKVSMLEYGDLSGIVFNIDSGNIVGGTQRSKNLDNTSEVVITKKFEKPTRTGTVAVGYVLHNGERFSYREVSWSKAKEKGANIAANKSAGEWDHPRLTEWMRELSELGDEFDMNLTMFDSIERVQFDPIEEFIEEEHWTENFEPPEGKFKFIVTLNDEKLKDKFLKRLGIQSIKKKTGNVWSVHWPEE